MKHIRFEVKTDGFYGAYWKNKMPSNAAIIAMLGDDAEDYMAKEFPKECKETKIDIDKRLSKDIKEWINK